MRKTLLILTLLVQLFFAFGDLWSQSKYPIYVTPTLLPPYSLNLSDYSAYGSQKLMVTIVVNDLEIANLPVKLRIKMETAGVTIENPPTLNTTPLFLDGGSANVLFGEDFVDYFNINNLQFKGYSKEAYRRSGQLPEGFYKFTVEVLHFHTNRVISNAGTVTAWIALGKPPLLRMPANDVQLGQYNGIPITFSWLASNVGSPISAGSIRYKFEMWEVRVKGVNPYNVVASMPVFHEYVTSSTSYSFNPASVMMEEGLTYAWRVTAFDESGLVPFEQNGQSEVRTFNYKSLCEEVQDITTTSSGQKGGFTWMPEKNHTSYNVEIKNAATGWFSANETFDSKVEFYELERGHTYELRVQAVCNSDPNSTSDYSQWKALTIAEAENKENNEDCPDCGCSDDMPKVELTNFELRKDLAPGDIISNKTGTTRFIVKKVEPQGDGIYKGVFYFWAEIWDLKIPCDFWNLQVNTDNVVVNMDYKSINDPKFLLDVDVLVDNTNTFLDQAAVLTSDGTIADTLKVTEHFDHIIVKDGQLVAVVISDDGKPIETPLNITAEEAKKKMITNDKGDALVINSKGEAMGAKEFQETGGGNTRLMNNYNKEKESKDLSASTLVTFSGHRSQKYGFDSYTEVKSSIQNNYPVLKDDHRPAFKSVASMGYDKVVVSDVEGIKFRDEMGVPSATVDGGISVTGAHNGSIKALYAYRENEDKTEEIVGKLNVVSFDNEPKRVHIIPVNDEMTFSPTELQTTLNTIYGQAVATWIVEPEEKITLDFPNGIMTHEGSGTFSTYNKDQKAIANAYEASGRKFVSGDLYLFFIKEATFKDRSLAGFMPLQRQIGFIYGSPSLETIAHELGHGSFNLRHTFSPEAFIVGEGKTQNLMDYTKGGTELWKHQWDLIHDPEKIMFAWAQEEEEGAYEYKPDKLLNEIYTEILSKNKLFNLSDIWDNESLVKLLIKVKPYLTEVFFVKDDGKCFVYDEQKYFKYIGVSKDGFTKEAFNKLSVEQIEKYELAHTLTKQYNDIFYSFKMDETNKIDEIIKKFYKIKKGELGNQIYKYTWIDGRTGNMIDPRSYYENDTYNFVKLEDDIKEFVLLKDEQYVNLISEEIDAAKHMRFNGILSMYGEYMYYIGTKEIPNITNSVIGNLQSEFSRYWENKDLEKWGLYWKWNSLKEERIAFARARMIAQMEFEQGLANHLQAIQNGKTQAWLDIGFGSATMTGSVLAVVLTEGGASPLAYISMGFAADQILGGMNMLRSIKNGFFDENKEYKIIKGLLINNIDDPNFKLGVSVVYDFSSIIVGAKAGSKTIESFKLSGNSMKKIIEGYSAGAEYINVTYGGVNLTIQLSKNKKQND